MVEAAYRLLIVCARASCGEPHLRDEVRADAARMEAEGGDWALVLRMAAHHGLLPGLTAALSLADWHTVPSDVRDRLQARHRRHVRKTLTQVAVLYDICGRLHETQIPAVSWKGPLLAHALYGSYVARESGDLDFLLEPDERTVAASLLKGMGFRRHRKTPTARLDRKIARLDGDLGFHRAADDVYVELHAQTMPTRFTAWQNRREYLRNATPMRLSEKASVLMLRPEDLLLSLASHAVKHHWERLKWVQDIAMFLRVYQSRLDWAALLAETRRTGKSHLLAHSAALAHRVFSAQVPAPLREAPEWAETAAITLLIAQLLRLEERGPASGQETDALTALLQSTRLSRMHFTIKRALEPQLCDFNDSFSRSPTLCKWHRVLRQQGALGVFNRASFTLRKAAR